MIEVNAIQKIFHAPKKEPGVIGSLKSFVNRQYIEKQAVKRVSLKVGPGEILGLVGANGAGKTTLVKMLSGIIHPTSGDATVLGCRPWERKDEFRRQIALIMGQKAQLWWDLPAADCFLLLKEIYQIEDAQFKRTLDFLVQTLDVGNELNIQIRRLSLGERMKMELIAALVHQPKVVYLDEPTIGLDLTAQIAIREFILKYRQEHKPAMILTSHYMQDIEELCERIVIMREGEIVYDGSLSSVVESYGGTKVLSVQTDGFMSQEQVLRALEEEGRIGEIDIKYEDGRWRFKVARAQVRFWATKILQVLPVKDLNIEDPDIGIIVEGLIRRRSS
jgi:ABC-2 type transport system ATP-binding protein